MTYVFRVAWVLCVALIAPVALPAGGASNPINSEIRRPEISIKYFAGKTCVLRASPLNGAPVVRRLEMGVPIRVLRTWYSKDGNTWLRVQDDSLGIIGSLDAARRGWINA